MRTGFNPLDNNQFQMNTRKPLKNVFVFLFLLIKTILKIYNFINKNLLASLKEIKLYFFYVLQLFILKRVYSTESEMTIEFLNFENDIKKILPI